MNTPAKTPATPAAPAKPKGRKPGQPAKVWDYTGLDTALLAAPKGVTAELASLAAPTRARDERQVAIDKVVTELHAAYAEAGKPDRWAAMPKRSYHVDPKAADTLRMLVRRAASFIGVSVRFGRAVRDREGREIVVFGVRDQRAKAEKSQDTWTLAELREFATEFFADDAEGAEEFLAALTGNVEDESGDESEDESGEAEAASA